jgi:hypothetical protein
VDPEAVQVLGRQIDPAPVEVLGQVADEVGQLEGQAELAGGLAGGRRVGRLQDRGQHGPDHRRRALHVATQLGVGAIAVHGQVHGHGVQEPLEVGDVQGKGPHGVEHGRQDRVLHRGAAQAGEQALAPGPQGGRLGGAVQG